MDFMNPYVEISPNVGAVVSTTASIKQYNYGVIPNFWSVIGTTSPVMTPINKNTSLIIYQNLYVMKDLYVYGSIINPSDINLKQNILELSDATSNDLMNLNVREFTFKSDKKNHKHFGLIAQEVEQIYPNLVFTNSKNVKHVNYIELIPVMIQKIQDLQKQIDELTKKI